MTKDQWVYMTIVLAYAALILSLLIASVWTGNWKWAATAGLIVLPSVIVGALTRGGSKTND